ncbi:MAG: response regulator transcription factor [Gammaproteobacteria bacterium]|nr:response regulator transcription factor [Gammaproteobacteria bacterium]
MNMHAHDFGTILIVDDTPANLAFLSDALDQVGYKVLVAMDGYSAINQLKLIMPDLILLDVLMPGIDGFETCRRLKNNDDTRTIPIIFMTALDGTADIVKGFDVGAIDYVTKPICNEEVLARVATRLHCSRVIKQFQNAADLGGDIFVIFDRDARVTLIASQARRMLTDYFGEDIDEAMLLPETLRTWLNGLNLSRESLPLNHAPYVIQRDGKRLTIRIIPCASGDQQMLVFNEHTLQGPSIDLLTETFDLTRREAEVIFWVAKGKTNRDIGLILNMSPRTVNKHLEHIYIKLGVETRTAAANKIIHTEN